MRCEEGASLDVICRNSACSNFKLSRRVVIGWGGAWRSKLERLTIQPSSLKLPAPIFSTDHNLDERQQAKGAQCSKLLGVICQVQDHGVSGDRLKLDVML